MSSVISSAPKSDIAKLYGYQYAYASASERAAIRAEAERAGVSSSEVLRAARSYSPRSSSGSSSSVQSISSSPQSTSSSYRVSVGMIRSDPLRSGGALSEAEYFAVTGQKLGEDYRQTKAEVLSAAGLSPSDVRLTKVEEEKLVGDYLSARYQAAFGEQTLRQPQARLVQDISLGIEKGYLRSQFEKENLAISENTLQEYISLKQQRPDITFAQYAYEKTIGSKSDIERFGLGLFSQQALGFYSIGKMISPSVKNEYLDLLTIAQSYRPAIETEGLMGDIARGYAPFQKNDIAYNLGVGAGVAIDIATLRAFGKGLISTVKSPKTVSAFLSEFRISQKLGAHFRDIQLSAKKLSPKEYVIKAFDPRSIPAQVKQVAKDAYRAITMQNTALDKEVRRLTSASRATIFEEKPPPLLPQNIGSGKVSARPIEYIRTEQGLSERSNVMFSRQVEEQLSKDMTKAVEQVRDYVRAIREKPAEFQRMYQPMKKLIEPPKLSIPKIEIHAPRTARPYRPSVSLSESARMLNAEKEEASRMIRQQENGSIPKTSEAKPVASQIQEQTSMSSQRVVTKIKTVEDEAMEAIARSRKEIDEYIAKTVRTRRRPTDIEYDIVRYPARVNIRPPILRTSIRTSTKPSDASDMMNATTHELNRAIEKEIAKIRTTQRAVPRSTQSLYPYQSSIIAVSQRGDAVRRTGEAQQPIMKPAIIPRELEAQMIRPIQIPRLTYREVRFPYAQTIAMPVRPPLLPKMSVNKKLLRPDNKKMQTEIYTYSLPSWVKAMLER